jgi:RimJ/RimL family protein N-acetyltransferase
VNPRYFTGRKVRLTRWDYDRDADAQVRWFADSEYTRLADNGPATIWAGWQNREWCERQTEYAYWFGIRTLDQDELIGGLDLGGINQVAGNAWVGIGVGEREYWGRGYGTEAMALLLRFGFDQLDLRRVTLNVFEYNQRAQASYAKLGFVEEGRQREWLMRGGKRWDLVHMGVLRAEWKAVEAKFLDPVEG